jgi:outer membrane biosynthesis protein TonB
MSFLSEILAFAAGAAAMYAWLRGPAGFLSKAESVVLAELAHIKAVLTAPTVPAPPAAPAEPAPPSVAQPAPSPPTQPGVTS